MNDQAVLAVRNLVKCYGPVRAVDDVSFAVARGEVLCLVGPNGSGKTTLVECIEGIREPDKGSVAILGHAYAPRERRPRQLGVQLQEESLPTRIRVGEAVDLFADLYGTDGLPERVVELLDIGALWKQRFDTLSGGQRRRVVVALAIVGDPTLVILDEPASGLDPVGQSGVEKLVAELREQDRAVCLTVHDMDQAERMGDRVLLLSHGRALADGPPSRLVELLGASHCIEVAGAIDLGAAAGIRVVKDEARTYAYASHELLRELSAQLDAARTAWSLRSVRLLDVYLTVAAGQELRSSEGGLA